MKKILLAAFAAASLTAGAQQVQGDFDAAWGKCIPWDSKNNKKESGTQPQGWKGSNVYTMIGGVKVCEEIAHETGKAVSLTNKDMVGQKIPAYITLGTPWATAETKLATVKEGSADGGAFGGIDFKWRPDGIRFQYMRDNSKGTERASVIAYIWNGTYTQKSVPGNTAVSFSLLTYGTATKVDMTDRDRNILGMSTPTGGEVSSTSGAACVAKIEEYITEAKSEWTTFEALFQGDGYSTADLSNAKLNIIISANDYFGDRNSIIADNSLTIDNVELIYYHALRNVSYDGTALTFDTDNYCDLSSVSYDAAKALTYTKVGVGATVEAPVYNEQTCRLTVTVKGNDFEANPESYTTYTVQFAKPVDVTKVVAAYSSALLIDMGEGGEPIPGVRVSLSEGTEPGTVNFELRNFEMGEGMMLGDIVLPNIPLIDNGDGTYGFGENAPVSLTLLGDIKATATLNIETSRVEGDNLTAHVDVMWVDEKGDTIMPIYVSAIGPKVYPLTLTDGRTVEAATGAYDVTLTRSFAKGWNTLCLPFDVNPAEFGVEGVKVQEFAGATGSSLDFKTVETVTANVPCLVYFPEAVASGLTLLTKTIASLGVQSVQQGDFIFKGSYEGSISMSGKYGVADVDGVQKIMRGGSASTLKGTRAYFDYSGAGNVQGMRLSLEGEGTTGIGGITSGNSGAGTPLYDLSGRRVQNVTKGGIYIQNGKKIIK